MREGGKIKSEAELKQERLSAALRENLKRRKEQARAKGRALTVAPVDGPEEYSENSAKN